MAYDLSPKFRMVAEVALENVPEILNVRMNKIYKKLTTIK